MAITIDKVISAGTTVASLGDVVFSNSNGVSFGANGQTITASHNALTSQSNQAFSAQGGSSAFQTLIFTNSNGFSFSNTGGSVWGSYTVPVVTNSSWTVSDAVTSQTIGRLAFTNANGLTMTLSTSNNGNATVFGSYTVPTVTNSSFSVQDSATTINPVARLAFSTGNNITLSLSTGASSATVGIQHNLAGTSTGFTGGASISGSFTHNSSGLAISLSHPAWITTAALSGDTTKYMQAWELTGNTAGTTSSAQGTKIYFEGGNSITVSGNSNTIRFSVGNYLTTAMASNRGSDFVAATAGFNGTNASGTIASNSWSVSVAAQTNQTMGLYMSSNTTSSVSSGTVDARSMTFRGVGIASVGYSGGEVVISVPAGGGAGDGGNTIAAGTRTATTSGAVLFSNANNFTWGLDAVNGSAITASYSQSNQDLSLYALGNTTQNSSTVLNASALSFNASNGGLSVGFSNGSIVLSNPPPLSSFQNMPGIFNSSVLTFGMTSLSQAIQFLLPQDGSFSLLRIPVTMSTNSTTIATMASATASAQGGLSHTFNAVIYSLGTGANSRSLQSVASGSCSMQFSQKISVTNSTQASYSLAITANALGEAGNTSRSTQYSVSNTNYSFTTNQIATEWSAGRFIDIPFANSLKQGNYWLIIGASSSTSSAGAAGLAALTNCHVRYSGHYGASQANVGFGVMGSTNMTSGGQLGAGFFSTAGGGTTNSIPISAISSTASNPMPFFMLLRSA